MFPLLGSSSSSTSLSTLKEKGKERAPTKYDEGGDLVVDGEEEESRPAKKKVRSDHENPGFAKAVAEEQARQMKLARVRISQSECTLTSVKNLRNQIIEERNEG